VEFSNPCPSSMRRDPLGMLTGSLSMTGDALQLCSGSIAEPFRTSKDRLQLVVACFLQWVRNPGWWEKWMPKECVKRSLSTMVLYYIACDNASREQSDSLLVLIYSGTPHVGRYQSGNEAVPVPVSEMKRQGRIFLCLFERPLRFL